MVDSSWLNPASPSNINKIPAVIQFTGFIIKKMGLATIDQFSLIITNTFK